MLIFSDQDLILQLVRDLRLVYTQVAYYGFPNPWIDSKEKYSPQ
jgi:hypothetical protein